MRKTPGQAASQRDAQEGKRNSRAKLVSRRPSSTPFSCSLSTAHGFLLRLQLPVDQAPPAQLSPSAKFSGLNATVGLYWVSVLHPTCFTCIRIMHAIAALPDEDRLNTSSGLRIASHDARLASAARILVRKRACFLCALDKQLCAQARN